MTDSGFVYVVTHPDDTDATVFDSAEAAEEYAAMFKGAVWDELAIHGADFIEEVRADQQP